MAADERRWRFLTGLEVLDEAGYAAYREAMRPILESYGGRFDHDFQVQKVLEPAADRSVNRVFMISFASQDQERRFFEDPNYRAVRQRLFEPAVGTVRRLAEFEG